MTLLNSKMTLFSAPTGSAASVNGEHSFALQFPHYIERGTEPLPPSYTVFQPGVTTEITYQLRVDVVRKGLRRHEKYAALTSLAALSRVDRGSRVG